MSLRIKKVNELLKNELAKIIFEEMPQFNLVSIHEVQTSADLSRAQVLVGKVGQELEERELKTLNNHARQFQYLLNKKVQMRKIPKLNFKVDSSYENVYKIETIINKIKGNEK